MQTVRKTQDASASAREALRKRGRASRSSANSLSASAFILGTGSEAPRRRLRLNQHANDATGNKHEKFSTFSATSLSEGSSTSRLSALPENSALNKDGSPKHNENRVNGTRDGTQPPLQHNGPSLRTGEDVEQANLKSRKVRQGGVAATGRICHCAIPADAATSDKAQTSLPHAGYSISTQRPQLVTIDEGRVRAAQPTLADCHFVHPATAESTGILGTPKNHVSVEVGTDRSCPMALDGHGRAPSATCDETGQMSHKTIASTSVIQLLLGKQLPSCTAPAVGLLESRLRGKLMLSNRVFGSGKSVSQHDRVARDETISEGEEHENRPNSGEEDHKSRTAEATESNGVTCCSSSSSTLQTHASPPLYYTVLTGNGLQTKQETTGNIVCLEEEADHENYPVVKGVSRDNTKKRWAVYWKGSRKYFYDKCYAHCHQAYLSAVEFRRQAKACNAPGPPPKKPTLQGEFYLPAPGSSFRFPSYTPAITTFPLTPSSPPAFPTGEATSSSAALLAKCGPAALTLSTAVPEHQVLGSTRHSDLFMPFNDREVLNSRSDPDPCISSPTTADSCDNVTDTLQRTLQGHIAKAERGGEQDLNQLLKILMPSLDRQLLPSELPRELQQSMLLQLTTLRL